MHSATIASAALAAVFARPMERVTTMDPVMSQSMYDAHAAMLVYETPLTVDYRARPYRLAPGYCDLPEVSADGRRYAFRALHGPADPVVASLKRLADPSLASPNSWMAKEIESVAAPDAATVEIRLRRRAHYFPWLMAMSPAAVVGPDGEGTGPYRLASWRKNHEMVFRRRGPAGRGFDEVRYLVIDDPSTQWLMFLKGEIDLLGDVSRDNWDSVVGPDGRLLPSLAAMGVRLHSSPSLDVLYVGINMRDRVLGGNRKLRQALNAAFDYPAWERFYNGRIRECDGPVPPGVDGRIETQFLYRYNPELAQRLLAEAGYPGGVDPATGRRLTLTLTIGRPTQDSREAGELMAAFYDRVGIRLELQYMTWDAFLRAVNKGQVQMFRMGWVADYPDAQNFLQLFCSRNVSPGPNHANYSNAEFDREYDAALDAPTVAERNAHWLRCQEIVREDCPWIFTHFNTMHSLTRSRVGDYVPSSFPYGQECHYTVGESR
ncbi:MAG: hypothetical protein IKE55_06960 [Kiritimatiellae bacterium]|nr:hypothetical protein [Kiritimatiellia bacterium]